MQYFKLFFLCTILFHLSGFSADTNNSSERLAKILIDPEKSDDEKKAAIESYKNFLTHFILKPYITDHNFLHPILDIFYNVEIAYHCQEDAAEHVYFLAIKNEQGVFYQTELEIGEYIPGEKTYKTLGRSESNDIHHEGLDSSVSKLHLIFMKVGDKLIILDLFSSNGTLLHKKPLNGLGYLGDAAATLTIGRNILIISPCSMDALTDEEDKDITPWQPSMES